MNKIRIDVDRNINYIYHMNAVAKCGSSNEYVSNYAHKYARLHAIDDLEIIRQHGGSTEYSPQVSEVMRRNFDIYIYNVWYEVRSELMDYAERLQKLFHESDFTEKADEAAGITSKNYFHAYLCNAIAKEEQIGVFGEHQILVGVNQTVEEAFVYIQKEYEKYLQNVDKG